MSVPKSYITILTTVAQLLPNPPHTPFSDAPPPCIFCQLLGIPSAVPIGISLSLGT